MPESKSLFAEFLGTFWLVLAGCGSAVIAAGLPDLGVGPLGIALAFGLAVVTMTYALGHLSGAHFNPAVTVGLYAAGKFPREGIWPYVGSQVGGAVAASLLLFLIASGNINFSAQGGFAANGYGAGSPGNYSWISAFLTEVTLTFFFMMVILGANSRYAPRGFAPLSVGLCFMVVYLLSLPITNGSVNPARSTGPALFAGTGALAQLWLFWVAPLLGAFGAGFVFKTLRLDQAPKAKGAISLEEEAAKRRRPPSVF